MGKKEKKIECLKKGLIELNNNFHAKKLINEAFYRQLMQVGFDFRNCILVYIFPDSSNTYCGKIIRQDGNLIEFDIDLDSAENSLFQDVTETFKGMLEKNNVTKPWFEEEAAYNLFKEMRADSGD